MNNYITQAELRAKGWSTLRIFRLGRPDAALLDAAPHPPGQLLGCAPNTMHVYNGLGIKSVCRLPRLNWRC